MSKQMKMKNISNKIFLIALSASLVTTSCSKVDFGNINENPDPTVARLPVTSKLFTNAVWATFGGTTGTHLSIASQELGLYAQYFMLGQYPEVSLYTTKYGSWATQYANPLKDLAQIIKYNTDPATQTKVSASGSAANQIAVARIMKAYMFSILTDQFGALPYKQALQGETIINPAYDSQQEIYADLFKELRESIAQFDAGQPMAGDIMFNGNIAKWKKFANSLRMVLAMRISKADAVQSKAEFLAAYNDASGWIATNADNAMFNYDNSFNFRSPWHALYDQRDDIGISETLVGRMRNILGTGTAANPDDPRLKSFANPTTAGTYVGIPYGRNRNFIISWTGANDYSRLGEKLTGWPSNTFNRPAPIITAAQMLLTKAEAAANGWIPAGDAIPAYNDAIKASWDQWGVTYTPAQLTTYLAGTAVAFTSAGSTDGRSKIGLQKWFAVFPNGHEGWSEWRRTGYPALVAAPDATNDSRKLPRRYAYPNDEITLNNASYTAAVNAHFGGSDTQDGRVWWDKP
jgi:hypothetical protein